MNKKGTAITILLGIVGIAIAFPLVGFMISGTIVNSDNVEINHDEVFSGSLNQISIESNFSIQEVSISINDTVVNHTSFAQENELNEPVDIYDIHGDSDGEIEDLKEADEEGITVYSEGQHCFYNHWEYAKNIFVFDLSNLENAQAISLESMISILEDEALVKIYYYDFDNMEWEKIDQKLLTQMDTDYDLEFPIPEELKDQDSIVFKITAYNSYEDFTLLFDQVALLSSYPSQPELLIYNVNVSDFEDGEYMLEVNILDFSFNPYVYESEILIDNTNPSIMEVALPHGKYNDTEIIQYHASIVDANLKKTTLLLNSSLTFYSVDFGNSSAISFLDVYLPGLYDYTIIAEDMAGNIDMYSGSFEILEYEEEPDIITNENEIIVYTTSAVPPEVSEAHSYINISGNTNYQYECNLTLEESVIDSQILYTNQSCELSYSAFNQTLNLTIYNLNNSNEIVYTKEFETNQIPIIAHYDKIKITCPTTFSEGYNLRLFIETENIGEIEFKVVGKDSMILASGELENGKEKVIFLDYEGEIEVIIYLDSQKIYSSEMEIKRVVLPDDEGLNATTISLLLAFIGLLIAGISLIFTVYKEKKKEDRMEEIIEYNDYMEAQDGGAILPDEVIDNDAGSLELDDLLLSDAFFVTDNVSQLGKAAKKGLIKAGRATKKKYQDIKAKIPETKQKISDASKKAARFTYIKTLGVGCLIIGIILGIVIITVSLPPLVLALLASLVGVFITTAVKTLAKKDITFFKSLMYSIVAVLVVIIIILVLNLLGYNSLSDYIILTQ